MMVVCAGNNDDHCCWVDGKVCPHLEGNTVKDRRWACGLLVMCGSWEAVYETAAWRRHVKPFCDRTGVRCGDWPPEGQVCATCGVNG